MGDVGNPWRRQPALTAANRDEGRIFRGAIVAPFAANLVASLHPCGDGDGGGGGGGSWRVRCTLNERELVLPGCAGEAYCDLEVRPVRPSVGPSVRRSHHRSVRRFIRRSVCRTIRRPIRPRPVCRSVGPSVCPPVCLSGDSARATESCEREVENEPPCDRRGMRAYTAARRAYAARRSARSSTGRSRAGTTRTCAAACASATGRKRCKTPPHGAVSRYNTRLRCTAVVHGT